MSFFDQLKKPKKSISDAGHNGSSMGQNGSSMSGPDFNQIGGFRNHVTTPNSEILCKNERDNITPEAHSQSLPALSQPSDLLHFLPLPQVMYPYFRTKLRVFDWGYLFRRNFMVILGETGIELSGFDNNK